MTLTILLIIRRSDSLNLFDNSIPLSWLHIFVFLLLVYLWLSFGFIFHSLIWGRIRGVEIIGAFHDPVALAGYEKARFHDAGFVDGWFLTFVDRPNGSNYSGINPSFKKVTAAFLVLVLGSLVSASHASMLAIPSIFLRRYMRGTSNRWLKWYYLTPIVPLILVLILSHVQFAYGGANRNWLQLYIAGLTIPLMALLLWGSVVSDKGPDPSSVQCLRRQRHKSYTSSAERLDSCHESEIEERTVALIGDSLSTGFCISSRPAMLFRMWRGWKPNWFLTLGEQNDLSPCVLKKIETLGPLTGFQHATVSAKVDNGRRRGLRDRLMDTWHFSHQVDEVLTARFPDMLLIWIGHNDVDWRSQKDTCTDESFNELTNAFVDRYRIQLRKLLRAAVVSKTPTVIIVFGLINFGSFFKARAQAEVRKRDDKALFPHLETDYKYFVSMKPEFREGMISLAQLYNQRLKQLCEELTRAVSRTDIRLIYSDAMASARIDRDDFLSPIDAWHPSVHGHGVLANSAYSTVYEQACFLGWNRTT